MSRRQRFLLCACLVMSTVVVKSEARTLATLPQSRGGQSENQHGAMAPESNGDTPDRAPVFMVGSAMQTPVHVQPSGPPVPTMNCRETILDQATGTTCLNASTIPVLGMLFPISASWFVSMAGDVGIGTTTPAAKLDVAGTARMAGTLTLNPGVDQALDVSTGSIYKGGVLFIHTKGSNSNTAIGRQALSSVTSGVFNTACGYGALFSNTNGYRNTASGTRALFFNTSGRHNTGGGYRALYRNTEGYYNTASGSMALTNNTTGTDNTASGHRALTYNTTGSCNMASGASALSSNTTGAANTASGFTALVFNTSGFGNTASGAHALRYNKTGSFNTATGYQALRLNTSGAYNTAVGRRALDANTTGSGNIALGREGGVNLTTGNDNIAIGNAGVAAEAATIRVGTAGTHTRAFIAGIRGVTTGVANAVPVLVDSAGQLGTVSSSRRFKKDIADMGDLTQRLLELRPVVFRYKQEQTMPNGGEVPFEYGLIAEEVAEIFPDLVVNDDEGKPFTVKYHMMSAMLLNELKKQAREVDELRSEVTQLRGLEARLAAVESRVSQPRSPAAIASDSR